MFPCGRPRAMSACRLLPRRVGQFPLRCGALHHGYAASGGQSASSTGPGHPTPASEAGPGYPTPAALALTWPQPAHPAPASDSTVPPAATSSGSRRGLRLSRCSYRRRPVSGSYRRLPVTRARTAGCPCRMLVPPAPCLGLAPPAAPDSGSYRRLPLSHARTDWLLCTVCCHDPPVARGGSWVQRTCTFVADGRAGGGDAGVAWVSPDDTRRPRSPTSPYPRRARAPPSPAHDGPEPPQPLPPTGPSPRSPLPPTGRSPHRPCSAGARLRARTDRQLCTACCHDPPVARGGSCMQRTCTFVADGRRGVVGTLTRAPGGGAE